MRRESMWSLQWWGAVSTVTMCMKVATCALHSWSERRVWLTRTWSHNTVVRLRTKGITESRCQSMHTSMAGSVISSSWEWMAPLADEYVLINGDHMLACNSILSTRSQWQANICPDSVWYHQHTSDWVPWGCLDYLRGGYGRIPFEVSRNQHIGSGDPLDVPQYLRL